jgi:hypothetical protein
MVDAATQYVRDHSFAVAADFLFREVLFSPS